MDVDVLVIGGGINGVGAAADAAGRGLSVVLCEKGDLASSTSSASTKLIHGGLRYLEYYKFSLVKESLKERSILLKRAPHLVHPLHFVFPYAKHMRPLWELYLGIKLYDFLDSSHMFPSSKYVNAKDFFKPLNSSYQKGFVYSDCQTDDARLVVLNAILAREKNAKILTRTECVDAKRYSDYWLIKINSGSEQSEIKAKAIINTTGPWVCKTIKEVLHAQNVASCRLVKGSHIIVPKLHEEHYAYCLQNLDNRVIFIVPYQEKYSLIGTTDLPFDNDLNKLHISEEEIYYLLSNVNYYLKTKITAADIVWSYSGVRSLYDDGKQNPSSITRECEIELDASQGAPLISLFGGKLTTYRATAARLVNKLHPYFPNMGKEWTENAILPGGELKMDFDSFKRSLIEQYSYLPKELLVRYAKNYGSLSENILQNAHSLANMGVDFGGGLYQKEVDYLVENEWAKTVEDILWRRSQLGLRKDLIKINELNAYLNGH